MSRQRPRDPSVAVRFVAGSPVACHIACRDFSFVRHSSAVTGALPSSASSPGANTGIVTVVVLSTHGADDARFGADGQAVGATGKKKRRSRGRKRDDGPREKLDEICPLLGEHVAAIAPAGRAQ